MSKSKLNKLFLRNKMLPLILALVIVFLVATGFVYANKKVNISADGATVTVSTLHNKPEDVLVQAGINLGSMDEYRLSTSEIVDGTVITVHRAVPVTVAFQGKTQEIMTGKFTVEELAESLGAKPESSKLVPSGQTKIEPNMHIQVITLTQQVAERDVVEPFSIMRRADSSMGKGDEKVIEAGQNGMKKLTVRLNFEDGVEVSAQQISETIIETPRPQVIAVGTRDSVETSRGAMRYSRVEMMEASAYLPSDGNGAGITATGIAARQGVVAVDPNVIPLGTRVYVPGYGVALAADTGGAIIGKKIDLCMEDYGEAIGFGRRSVEVYVLD